MEDHTKILSVDSVPVEPAKPRVIVLSMIKNESRIIKRCIQSTLSIADAICICDTGSTDNTVELLTEYLKNELSKIWSKVEDPAVIKDFLYQANLSTENSNKENEIQN